MKPKRKTLRRPIGMPDSAMPYVVWVSQSEFGVRIKIQDGAGVGIRKDNPFMHEVIGETICNEAEVYPNSPPKPEPEPTRENERLNDVEREVLWHAIGMTTRNYRRNSDWWASGDTHRNNYCANIECTNHADIIAINRLVHLGLMKAGAKINEGQDQYFHVTYAGIKLAREEFFRARQNAKT